MDHYIGISIGILIGLSFVDVFVKPFFFGKERNSLTPIEYVVGLMRAVAVVLVVGRVLYWW